MSTKKDNKQWFYIYIPGCGPCKRLTPIIDGIMACGLNIKKALYQDFLKQYPHLQVSGTPSLILVDFNDDRIIDKVNNQIMLPLIDLTTSAPELLNTTFGEYLVSRLKNT